jgi:hypothetical protein
MNKIASTETVIHTRDKSSVAGFWDHLRGDLIEPTDPGYEEARQV